MLQRHGAPPTNARGLMHEPALPFPDGLLLSTNDIDATDSELMKDWERYAEWEQHPRAARHRGWLPRPLRATGSAS